MQNKGTPTDDNMIKTITYSVVGGGICLAFMPGYIPYVICYSGIIGSLYGIGGTPTDDNMIKTITYSVVGGGICLAFMPGYIPYVICYSGIIGSLYGIGKILEKYKDGGLLEYMYY